MRLPHSNRVALVTGAAMGLGQAFAQRLAVDGADLVLADVVSMADTVALVKTTGRHILPLQYDVSQESEVASLAAEAESRFDHIDILINNAGIYPQQRFEDITLSDWRRVMQVNLEGMFLMAKALTPGMRRRNWGRVINVASNTVGLVIPALVHYVASKAGVIGFTRALATELASYGITVNAVAPGLTRTAGQVAAIRPLSEHDTRSIFDLEANRQAIKRIAEPQDIAGAVSFLASEAATFMTGQTLFVDGGLVRN